MSQIGPEQVSRRKRGVSCVSAATAAAMQLIDSVFAHHSGHSGSPKQSTYSKPMRVGVWVSAERNRRACRSCDFDLCERCFSTAKKVRRGGGGVARGSCFVKRLGVASVNALVTLWTCHSAPVCTRQASEGLQRTSSSIAGFHLVRHIGKPPRRSVLGTLHAARLGCLVSEFPGREGDWKLHLRKYT